MQFIQIVLYAEESVIGVHFGHDATHAVAVVMGDWALVVSVEGGVVPPTDDPEQAILFHMIWSCVVTLEAAWEGGALVFGANDLVHFQAVFSLYLFPSSISGPLSCKDAWDKGGRGGGRMSVEEVWLKLSEACCCHQVALHITHGLCVLQILTLSSYR